MQDEYLEAQDEGLSKLCVHQSTDHVTEDYIPRLMTGITPINSVPWGVERGCWLGCSFSEKDPSSVAEI